MNHNGREVEIKLAVPTAAVAARLLRSAGLRLAKRRVFERNIAWDTPAQELRNASRLLRVRQAGAKSTLTYKGKPGKSKHKSREELELQISDASALSAIFERLGYRPSFRYEKYRTEYSDPRSGGTATIDETPIGVYLELEGSPAWIDRTAHRLGFTEQDYITSSYGRLYADWCKRQRATPGNMEFNSTLKTP
jgi:adenylate cyclase class 2